MILNLLYFIGFLFLIILIITGVILIIISLIKKSKNKIVLYTGIAFCGIPALIFLLNFLNESFFEKPNQKELIGTYKISKITTSNIASKNLDKYKLRLFKNGEFQMTPISGIETCEKGNYELDYDLEYNELSFYCGNVVTTAHIDGKIGGYSIEFIIGDPDSGKSIYFEKIN